MRFLNFTRHFYLTLTLLTIPGAFVVGSDGRPRLGQEMPASRAYLESACYPLKLARSRNLSKKQLIESLFHKILGVILLHMMTTRLTQPNPSISIAHYFIHCN